MGNDERIRVLVAEGDYRTHEEQRKAVAGLLAAHFGHTVAIAHTPEGAPFIPIYDGHISISHCSTAVAVAVSPHPVGIDIESPRHDKMRRVAPRFIANNRLNTDIESPTMLAATWCAKEATYKLYRGKVYKTHVEIPYPVKHLIFKIKHTANYTLAVVYEEI